MQIHGLQKLTLLDYPGKTACTVFFGHCNFRCPFCHNASLVLHPDTQPTLPEREVLDFIRSRKGRLDGVCITGGEPTLEPDLLEFMGKLKGMGLAVKLDTNGWNPEFVETVTENGLVDYVAMDIKSSPSEYPRACGVRNFDLSGVKRSVELLMRGKTEFEFRTTVVKGLHTPEVMTELARWIAGPEPYFLQAFKDSGDILGTGCEACTPQELRALRDAVLPWLPQVKVRGAEI